MASRRALLLVVLCAAALCAAATAVEDRTAAAAIVARPRPEEQAPILLEQGAGEDDFDKCKTCIFVIERIKKGTNMLLPSICAEIFEKFPKGTAYADCHQTLNALSTNGNNVRYWLFEGCYKYEIYQAKEWVKPCPSHVMCSVLKNLQGETFCPPVKMEIPWAGGEGGGAAGGGGGGGGGNKKGGGRK